MALLHSKSAEFILSEVELFEAPLTQFSIQDKVYIEELPLTALTDGSRLELFIPGDSGFYLDFSDLLLFLQLKSLTLMGQTRQTKRR